MQLRLHSAALQEALDEVGPIEAVNTTGSAATMKVDFHDYPSHEQHGALEHPDSVDAALHAQAQNEHWRMLAEERAATIDSLRTELQHAQVLARGFVRMCPLHMLST